MDQIFQICLLIYSLSIALTLLGFAAAISVSGMTSRVTNDRLPLLGRAARDAADELTVALGGVMPEAKSS